MSAPPTVYVCADLHLGHPKVAVARGFGCADAHDDAIVAAWNAVVHKKDTVYVLGDVFRLDRVAELVGTKKLAMGNHDQRATSEYLKLFSQVRAMFDFDGCLLTHIPVHASQFARWRLNVHGHTHANSLDWDRRYVATSLEQLAGFAPTPLRLLIDDRTRELESFGVTLAGKEAAAGAE